MAASLLLPLSCPSSLLRLALTTPPEVWGCTYGSHSWRWPITTLLFLVFLPSLWDWSPSLTQASILLLRSHIPDPLLSGLPAMCPASGCSSPGLQGILGGPFYPCFLLQVCNTNTTPEDPQTCCPGCKSVYLLLLAQLVTSRPPALPWPSYLCPLHQMG